MKNLALFIIISLSILFVSCEKDANIDLGEFNKELVITSFISPSDESTEVTITYSRSFYGDNNQDVPFEVVANADVEISDHDGIEVTLPYDQNLKVYTIDANTLPITEGKTYYLSVTLPDGTTATSQCTVPINTNSSIEVVGISSILLGDAYEYHFDLKWDDIVAIKNYYRVHAFVDREVQDETGLIFHDFERIKFQNEYDVFDDVLFENVAFTLRDGYYYDTYFDDFTVEILNRKAYIYLLNTDENYFKYHNTINSNVDSGYFIEPSLIYTNIEGGLGCFGAFTSYQIEVDF